MDSTAKLLREAYDALNDQLVARLVELGHDAVRPAHAAVFQHLDEGGTTVTVLAERAQMTKQSMAELVRHLESWSYLERVTDPNDRRAKVVTATDWGQQILQIVTEFEQQTEAWLDEQLGARRAANLRQDLDAIRSAAPTSG